MLNSSGKVEIKLRFSTYSRDIQSKIVDGNKETEF